MRVLHLWPVFNPARNSGASYYLHALSEKLVARGVEVDTYTTASTAPEPVSHFALNWPNDAVIGHEQLDGMRVHRFASSFSPPKALGHVLSLLTWRRWRQEEGQLGLMQKGSPRLQEYYRRRAMARPRLYDWLFMAGLGPWSRALRRQAARAIPGYDVVLAGYSPFALMWQVLPLVRRHGKPLVLLPLFHPDDVYHHHRSFYECYGRADAVLAQTPYSLRLLRQLAPDSNPVEIGAGVDLEAFAAPDIDAARFRAKYGLHDRRLVLIVGRKESGKRYDLAVDAVDRLADDGVRLVMIGSDADRKPIESPYVVQLGQIPRADLIDAYDACDVLVHPSEHESFGMVLLEAWMRRKPVIGSARCGPVASLIHDGEDGFLCWNAQEIAERIRLLLDTPELARRLGEAGHRKTLKRYTWDIIADKVADLYRDLAARGPRP